MAEVNYESTPIINGVTNKIYTFEDGACQSSKLKVIVRGNSNRYGFSKPLILRVLFQTQGDYDSETKKYSYVNSNYQNITFNTYSDDNKVSYKEEEISLSGNYIKSIEVIGEADKLEVYKEAQTVTSDNFKDYAYESGFIIPIVDALPDVSEVQNGYVCILRSMI